MSMRQRECCVYLDGQSYFTIKEIDHIVTAAMRDGVASDEIQFHFFHRPDLSGYQWELQGLWEKPSK